jgi:hypothetical protein
VVVTSEVRRPVHDADGGRFLYYTEQTGISPGIPADGAGLLLRQVAALLTGMYPLPYGREDRGQPLSLFRRLLEQMESEPLSRLPAYPREPGKFRDQLLDCAHRLER